MSIASPRSGNSRGQTIADLALLIVALIWGSTFVMVKDATSSYPVFSFLAIRFALGGVALTLVAGRRLKHVGWRGLGMGVILGVLLFGGYALQTIGLRYTSASKAGFITGLSVVMVPLLTTALLRRRPAKAAVLGTLLAAVGLALLSLDNGLAIASCDLLLLGCAVCFALHVVGISAFAPRTNPMALAAIQVWTVAILSAGVAAITDHGLTRPDNSVWFAAAFTGIVATAAALGIQNSAQRHTPPTHAALILTAEPVFAAIFGVLLGGDVLVSRSIAGGVLIVAGMLAAEIPWETATAQFVSRFLAPQYAMIPMFLLVALQDETSPWHGLAWGAAVGVTSLALPVTFLWVKFKRGKISDWHISDRKERLQPSILIMSLLVVALPIIALLVFHGPRLFLVALVDAAVLLIVNTIITSFWKISQHVTTVSALATFMTALGGVAAAPTFLLIPVVAWARVRVGAHTRLQTVAGAASGALITIATLFCFQVL